MWFGVPEVKPRLEIRTTDSVATHVGVVENLVPIQFNLLLNSQKY